MAELFNLIKEFDRNANGTINFAEFQAMVGEGISDEHSASPKYLRDHLWELTNLMGEDVLSYK